MKKVISVLMVLITLSTGCTIDKSDERVNSEVNSKSVNADIEESNSTNDNLEVKDKNNNKNSEVKDSTQNKKEEKQSNNEAKNSNSKSNEGNKEANSKKSNSITEKNVSEKVKSYIINGQDDKIEADKIQWSKSFLNQLNIEELYKKYKSSGGDSQDIKEFAKYITLNAPIPSNWEELFKKDLYDTYGEEVSRLEHLQDDLYQAYVKIDNKEVPYVVVSSRTGYYHG